MFFRLLGPLEVRDRGVVLRIERRLSRAILACLLLHGNDPVSKDHLIDELWGEQPPRTALASLQNHVSRLRKALGPDRIELEVDGYVLRLAADELDLWQFERLVCEANDLVPRQAATILADALALWRGEPLGEFVDEPFAHAARLRLEELRLAALERRLDADLAAGRHSDVVAELTTLAHEHPLRERFRAQLMLALYRCGRQAEALDLYRTTRELLIDDLGIEPGRPLRDLQHAILKQAPALEIVGGQSWRSVLIAPLERRNLDALLLLAAPVARVTGHEVIVALLLAEREDLGPAIRSLDDQTGALRSEGCAVRSAVFTSAVPGSDLVRLAREQNVDVVLTEMPPKLSENQTLLSLLADAPRDVAVATCDKSSSARGPVLVPFGGAEHDWAAIEVAAWFAKAYSAQLILAGPTADGAERDASRLLATAALAVDRALGIVTKPLLVERDLASLRRAADEAGLLVVGFSPRWRERESESIRLALAAEARPPAVLVRQGLRPSVLAPSESLTRFTWSVAGPVSASSTRA